MSSMESQNLILYWNGFEPRTQSLASWCIIGIQPDGSFYGEKKIELAVGQSDSINIEGTISEDVNRAIRTLAFEICELNLVDKLGDDNRQGLLAYGHVSNPKIVLRYSPAVHEGSVAEDKFLRIVASLRDYLRNS